MPDSTTTGSLERYLGNTLREIRLKHGLTIADVATLANISRGMLSKIENAQTATSLETLSRLAQALAHGEPHETDAEHGDVLRCSVHVFECVGL